jgi:hypothetical protein
MSRVSVVVACTTLGCMSVHNHAPVTARTASYEGTGETQAVIERDFPVRRIDRIPKKHVLVPVANRGFGRIRWTHEWQDLMEAYWKRGQPE